MPSRFLPTGRHWRRVAKTASFSFGMSAICWAISRAFDLICYLESEIDKFPRKAPPLMKPILQALVLADKVYEEKSGKKIIAGTFNRIHTGKAPTQQVAKPDGTTQTVVQGGT